MMKLSRRPRRIRGVVNIKQIAYIYHLLIFTVLNDTIDSMNN